MRYSAFYFHPRVNMLLQLSVVLAIAGAPVIPGSTLEPRRQDSFDRAISRIAENLSPSLSGRVVAVLEFPNLENRTTTLGRLVSEQLTTDLVKRLGTQARVVERRQVVQVQRELEFLQTELSPAQIDSLGRALGADAIVIGSASVVGEQVIVNVRAVGVPGWQVLGADRMNVRANREVLRLAADVQQPAPANRRSDPARSDAPDRPSASAPAPAPPPPPAPKRPATVVTTGSLRVELSRCSISGVTLTCEMIFTDEEDGRLGLFIVNHGTGNSTRLIDPDGQERRADAGRLGSMQYGRLDVQAVAGVPVRGAFQFRDVPRMSTIPVLEIQIWHAESSKTVRFRDVVVN
jgi:TolB-like protein